MKVPNAITRQAIAQLESGHGKRFDSVDALFEDLGIDKDLQLARTGSHADVFDK